jgi:hypothetical protein
VVRFLCLLVKEVCKLIVPKWFGLKHVTLTKAKVILEEGADLKDMDIVGDGNIVHPNAADDKGSGGIATKPFKGNTRVVVVVDHGVG